MFIVDLCMKIMKKTFVRIKIAFLLTATTDRATEK